ncbi:MAG: STAS domain-containing protein [Planctomycetota bacterium]
MKKISGNEALKKKDTQIKLIGIIALIVYVINLVVLCFFTFPDISNNSNLLIIFLVGLATTTILIVSVYFSIISAHTKIQAIEREMMVSKKQSADAQTHLKILSSILKITSVASQHLEISRILNNIVKVIRECLDADQVSLMLIDENDNRLYTKAVDGEYGPELEHIWKSALEVSEAIAGWVTSKGKGLLLDDDTDFSIFEGYVKKLAPIHSAMSVPLHFGTRITGVININRLKSDHMTSYKKEDLMLLSIFADDIAMMIENARLTRELKKSKAFSDLNLEDKEQVDNLIVPRIYEKPDDKKEGPLKSSSQITTQKIKENIMVISITGTLNYIIGEELEQTFHNLMNHGMNQFIVNLSMLERISSEGIGILTSLIDPLQKKDGHIILVQPNSQVRTALSLFGLQEFFPIVDDLPTALKTLTKEIN